MIKRIPKLDLNITNHCNYRCTHCAFDSGLINMPELSWSELKDLLIAARALGGTRFDITGGEPLVRPNVDHLISSGKELGYKIELVTNGSLLSAAKLKYFRELGLDAVAISLDGSNPEIYNLIRGQNNAVYDRVVANISAAVASGYYTKINTTVFQSNLLDLPKIIEFGLQQQVSELGLYYFTPVGRGERSSEFSVEPLCWLDFIATELSCYQNLPLKITLEVPLLEKNRWQPRYGCLASLEQNHLQVLPDGNVYPCAIMAAYHQPLANLHQSSITELCESEQLWTDYWQQVSPIFQSCQGACVNYKAFDLSSYSAAYLPVCPLRKFRLEELL